jgi:hypothetical protein
MEPHVLCADSNGQISQKRSFIMNTQKKLLFILTSAIMMFALGACSGGPAAPTVQPSTATPVPPTATPVPPTPMPDLAGYWHEGTKVFTIEMQGDKFVVTDIKALDYDTRTITSQNWDGSVLSWTYAVSYADGRDGYTVTDTTVSLEGDTLTFSFVAADQAAQTRTMFRTSSAAPSYSNDFSDPNSGWSVDDTEIGNNGYGDGYYFVTSKTDQNSKTGWAPYSFGDTVINVDATPFSGPTDSNFGYFVQCRTQTNGDAYRFEVTADGYFSAGYFADDGYTSLLSGDVWQTSTAIQQGMVTNHITLTCAGSHFKFEVNGVTLYEGDDTHFTTEGEIGLGVAVYDPDATAEVRFDNLAVTAP